MPVIEGMSGLRVQCRQCLKRPVFRRVCGSVGPNTVRAVEPGEPERGAQRPCPLTQTCNKILRPGEWRVVGVGIGWCSRLFNWMMSGVVSCGWGISCSLSDLSIYVSS
jgi:hypothetical protein